MNITFIFPRETEYNSDSIRQKPSGGTEKSVIFLGEAFQKLGHQVTWITTAEQLTSGTYDQPPDVVIAQEAEFLSIEAFKTSKKVWWTHHFHDQPIIQRSAAFGRAFADKVVTLSRCHHDDIKAHLRLDSTVIGHGVWLDEVHWGNHKDPYRLIYASTPYRGLERIPELFRAIKAHEPRATIAICSSMKTYGADQDDSPYQAVFDKLAVMDGVELLGSLNQEQLYTEYAKASIFFYPNIWPETYCISMDEAIAHGCCVAVPRVGALNERIEKSIMGGLLDYLILPTFIGHQPKNWLDIAHQWQEQILN